MRWCTLVATRAYERQIAELLSQPEREQMETMLALYPERHPVIPESGGMRKMRWSTGSTGKRGGLRVIYYLLADDGTVFLVTAYAKNRKENLTQGELRAMRAFAAHCKEERSKAHGQDL